MTITVIYADPSILVCLSLDYTTKILYHVGLYQANIKTRSMIAQGSLYSAYILKNLVYHAYFGKGLLNTLLIGTVNWNVCHSVVT